MSIAKNIRDARLNAELTQVQLAALCNPPITDSTLRKYESGKVTPKMDMLTRIAAALGMEATDLIYYNQPRGYKLCEEHFKSKIYKHFVRAEDLDNKINAAAGYDETARIDTVPDCMVNRFDVYAKAVAAIDTLDEELKEYLDEST